MSSSFRKRGAAPTLAPPSTRVSAHNGTIMTSTGIATLDDVLGGGMAVGTTLLLQEDAASSGYARLMLRYFLAQGVAAGHATCVVASAADEPPVRILREVMAPVGADDGGGGEGGDDGEDGAAEAAGGRTEALGRTMGGLRADEERMRIAWRYQNQGKFGAVPSARAAAVRGSGTYCFKFDITKAVPQSTLDSMTGKIALIDVDDWVCEEGGDVYERLLGTIKEIIQTGRFKWVIRLPLQH
ncbi:Elongator subunit elp4 [Cladochytrium tenue]|nr:Elongator subunit elp4 [Cladochytrium tenue]